MARVIMAADISGTRDGKAWPRIGSEVDLPDQEAADLVRSGAAVEPDDPRAERLRGGYHAGDAGLAGAPTGRDATEGQPDTNLARARYLASKHGDDKEAARAETRAAAERVDYTDEQTADLGSGRVPGAPVVGDDKEASVADPAPKVAERDDDGASGLVESADASTAGEERAVVRSKPARR